MTPELKPADIVFGLSITRRVFQWIRDEAARTGRTEAQIIAKYDASFDANDVEMAKFLDRLK